MVLYRTHKPYMHSLLVYFPTWTTVHQYMYMYITTVVHDTNLRFEIPSNSNWSIHFFITKCCRGNSRSNVAGAEEAVDYISVWHWVTTCTCSTCAWRTCTHIASVQPCVWVPCKRKTPNCNLNRCCVVIFYSITLIFVCNMYLRKVWCILDTLCFKLVMF